MKKYLLYMIAILFAAVLLAGRTSHASTASPNDCQLFLETGKNLCNTFLAYWNTHGGVPQQGFPISDELQETSQTDGKTYTVQYFERAVLELHPENKGKSSEVLLILLGSQRYLEIYGPDGAADQRVSTDNPLTFAETGHSVGGIFRTYWEQNGGLAQQGYPISDEFDETSILDGKRYIVQYFQRSVFELHPENAGTPYEVLLTQLGSYSFRSHYGSLTIPGPSSPELVQLNELASDRYFVWTDFKKSFNPFWSPSVSVVTRAVDLLSGQVITVTTNPGDENFSAISGSVIVGQKRSSTPGCAPCYPDVIGKDLSTGASYTFATGPGLIYSVQVSGRSVAWVEQDDQTERIVVMDIDTRAVTIPFSRSREALGDISFQLGEQYLVWAAGVRVTKGNYSYIDMRSYSFRDGQTRQLAYYIGYTPHMDLSGRYLTWQDLALHLTNLDTGTTTLVSEEDTFGATLQGDMLVWITPDVTAQTASSSPNNYILAGMKQSDMQPRALLSFTDDLPQFWVAGDWLVWQENNSYNALPISQAFRNSRAVDVLAPAPVPDDGATPVQASIQSRVVGADNQLFWLGAGTATRVYSYDITTRKKTILYESPEQKLTLATDGHALVWMEFVPMGRYRIMHYDLATSEVSTVVQTSAPDYNSSYDYGLNYQDDVRIARPYLAVDEGVLYYTDTDPGHKGLWARILSTGKEQLISPVGQNPMAADGRLLWLERQSGFGELLHLRTTALSSDDTILTNEQYYLINEYAVAGDNVLWIDQKSGKESLTRYNMRSGAKTLLPSGFTSDAAYFSNLAMRGNTAVWTEEGSNGSDYGWAIRSLDLGTGVVSTVQTAGSGIRYQTRAMPNEQTIAYIRQLPSTGAPKGDLFVLDLP